MAGVARILPVDEWWRLDIETPTLKSADLKHPGTLVVVVEDAGRIMACWAALTVVHVEGLWAHEGHGAGVLRALIRQMVEELRSTGQAEVLTQAADPRIVALLEHVGGQPLPGVTYVFPLADLEVR